MPTSRDLHGFHLYGADLCLIADILGYSAYVVDFHLRHKSVGNKGSTFEVVRAELIEKYRRALRYRVIGTPSTIVIFRIGVRHANSQQPRFHGHL